ncbi:MAG: hypothetical protein Q8P28_04810 [Deltaproteobacteria bacterium]|nr:hypothetical protein [Deltaproteobacteria bacterium]
MKQNLPDTLLKPLKTYFEKRDDVVFAFLFGSSVTGTISCLYLIPEKGGSLIAILALFQR